MSVETGRISKLPPSPLHVGFQPHYPGLEAFRISLSQGLTIIVPGMADQLTSVGVEFSKTEMSRIFYDIRPTARARKWGLGLINNPNGLSSYPDWLWSYAAAPYRWAKNGTTDYLTRTPGGYQEDNKIDQLIEPNELIHPCVRIRYLYGGLNMDDMGPWKCRALTEHGYSLQRVDKPNTREPRVPGVPATYHSISGPVEPFYDMPPAITTAGTAEHPFVRIEQPQEDELHQLAEPQSHWAWVHKDPQRKALAEEHIGMWERLFIKTNEKLVRWQDKADADAAAAAQAEKKGIFASAGEAIMSRFGGAATQAPRPPPPPPTVTPLAVERKREHIPETYGYHDIVSWQKGDTQPRE